MPFVVGGQLAMLFALRAYARRPRVDWLLRVTAAWWPARSRRASLLGLTIGFEGISRERLRRGCRAAVDCRARLAGHVGARARARARTRVQARGCGELVDRAEEMTTLGAVVTSLYALPRAAQEPRHQGSQAEVPRLGVRLPVVAGQSAADDRRLHGRVHLHPAGSAPRLRLLPDARHALVDVLRQLRRPCRPARSSTTAACSRACLFPRAILPIATVLFNLAQYLLTCWCSCRSCCCGTACRSSAPMLLFPVFLALQVVFTIGVALILATATAFFRDVRHLLEVALSRPVLDDADRVRAASGARAASSC